MKRRTVELGRVQVVGFRLQGEGPSEEHFVLLRILGRVVEFPVASTMAKTVRRLYGYRARHALLIDVGDATKGKAWLEQQVGEPKPPTLPPPDVPVTPPPARPKSKPKGPGGRRQKATAAALSVSEALLARALAVVGGVRGKLGPAIGSGTSTVGNITRAHANGYTMTRSMRAKLEALVAGAEKK